jgi:hypothetical protein
MAKRRTSGIQRRQRASSEALNRRVQSPAGGLPLDWRILLIGGVLLVGAIVLIVVLVVGRGPSASVGERQVSDGQGHVPACTAGNYSSTPPTSGCHLDTPANWGVYTVAQDPTQLIHNLEHGGIVIWYQPDQTSEADINALAELVNGQLAEGTGGRFKFILSPWEGEDFGHPIAVTAWEWLLYLDTADTDAIDAFREEHYGEAPEPLGGPGL